MNTIFKYEWKLFLRNKIAIGAWFIMLLIGLYAIYYGRSFYTSQLETITGIDTAYQSRIKNQLANFSADTTTREGKSRYQYAHNPFMNEWQTRPMVWKRPQPLQALTIGQSDNQPFYYNLWVYNNVYNTKQVEIRNPAKLLSGNFDLAFVFIYLVPLLVIAFCYNMLSADTEAGITGLLSVQGLSAHKLTSCRLLFRGLLVVILAMLLSIAGFVANGVHQAQFIAGWLATSLLYLFFWLSIVYAVVSFRKSSSITALSLVSLWVIFLLVIPSVVNSLQKTEDETRISVADADREFSNYLWQKDKKSIIDTLMQVRPDWRKYPVTDTNEIRSIAYSYLNMLNMNKIGSGIDQAMLHEQRRLERFNFLNPAFSAQLLFNRLAGSEIDDFVFFREQAVDYQLARSEIINDFRMSGKSFNRGDFEKYPVFLQKQPAFSAMQFLSGSLSMILLTAFGLMTGRLAWRRKEKNDRVNTMIKPVVTN